MQVPHEMIRHTLLLQLEAAYPISLPQETLLQGLQLAGIQVSTSLLDKELAYLQDKGFLVPVANALCPHLHRYKLSTQGIDFLENEKAIPQRF